MTPSPRTRLLTAALVALSTVFAATGCAVEPCGPGEAEACADESAEADRPAIGFIEHVLVAGPREREHTVVGKASGPVAEAVLEEAYEIAAEEAELICGVGNVRNTWSEAGGRWIDDTYLYAVQLHFDCAQDEAACTADADCADGFCGKTAEGEAVCVPGSKHVERPQPTR